MRRISSLVLPGLALSMLGSALFLSGSAPGAVGQDAEKDKTKAKSQLDGAWRLVSAQDPNGGAQRKPPEQIEMTKLVVGGRFVWSVVQDGKAVAGAGGRYTVADDAYTEEVVFAIGPNQLAMVAKSFKFNWKIEDGKWHHTGTLKVGDVEQEIDEFWERIP
jgi:hypothetical protein